MWKGILVASSSRTCRMGASGVLGIPQHTLQVRKLTREVMGSRLCDVICLCTRARMYISTRTKTTPSASSPTSLEQTELGGPIEESEWQRAPVFIKINMVKS